MPPVEKSPTGTLENTPIPSGNRRRRPLRSRTADIFFHILSVCYDDSSHTIQNPDKSDTQIESITKNKVFLDGAEITPNDSLCQEKTSIDDTRVALDAQKLHNIQPKSTEHDHKIDTNPLNVFDTKNKDNNYDIMSSSPRLPTDKDIEEGEISGDFMDLMLEDFTQSIDNAGFEPKDVLGIETELENVDNLIPLVTDIVEDVSKNMSGILVNNKITRNLVDYSEIVVHGKSKDSVKKVNSERVLSIQSNIKNIAVKNQDFVHPVKVGDAQNTRKRQGSCSEEERTNKKSKKFVDPIPCLESQTLIGQHVENGSQEVVDASTNEDANEMKKKKRVLTKERKAKKKRNERIKRAEKNKKLGVKRLKIEPVIKEKKISYCRHFVNGRCHEGEKCKFSHDTTPVTKSRPCGFFAKRSCMKGDDCPFDHQLSKYLCNNIKENRPCPRGSDCLFSHEAPLGEVPLNTSNESNPEQKTPSNAGSKKLDTKSCSVPKFVKISTQPPKGISFLSQRKFPLEPHSSLKADDVVKEITKTPLVVQDSKEITKTPLATPRGVNFLSFGKKPDLGNSNGGFSFKIGNTTGESSKSESTVNVVNGVKGDFPINRPIFSQKSNAMMSFMSSTSQRAFQSTLAFASKIECGVKSKD